MGTIREDMDVLGQVAGRFAGTEGERAMLHAIRQRMPDGWLVRVEGFVGHHRPDWIVAAHVVVLLLIGLLGVWWPAWMVLPAAVVCASLLGEATGQFSLLRRLVLKAASYNLVARDARKAPLGSVVLTTNLDVSRYRRAPRRGLRLMERAWQGLLIAALAVTVAMAIRAVGDPIGPFTVQVYLVLLGTVLLMALIRLARRPARQGRDEAGGPAVLLELLRRFGTQPVPGVEVWVAFTGCGHAYQDGMHHMLDLHDAALADPVLVIALDEPERAPLKAVVAEGPVFVQPHRATGPALVERLRWAGLDLPEIRLFGATDARAAQVRDVRSLALTGGDGSASPEAASRAADLVEVMVRWYAEDVGSVAGDRSQLQDLARALSEEPPPQRRRGRLRRKEE